MADLAHVLRQIPQVPDPDLLLGGDPADDAAVYRMRDDFALVQTVDFFTPVVDDPYLYGQIAAANSLSDVYAVGGTPLTALNVAAFPVKSLPTDILVEILRGGADKAAEAGVPIIGGHTVDDEEPKYGLSVTGIVDPSHMVTPHGARPGDVLVLTKPLGTGTIATGLKSGMARPEDVRQATFWMTTLNADASIAMRTVGASAATDVTGFGLLGHLSDMCRASGVCATVRFSAVPVLPFALQYIRAGQVPGGTMTNLENLGHVVDFDPALDGDARLLLADPQTSGGLLIAVPPHRVEELRREATGQMVTAEIGTISEGEPGTIHVLP